MLTIDPNYSMTAAMRLRAFIRGDHDPGDFSFGDNTAVGVKLRHDPEEYTSYYQGMGAAMQEKVARGIAHFPHTEGTLLDIGFGEGESSAHFASLYPGNRIIGVELDPKSVLHAQGKYSANNLLFIHSDILELRGLQGGIDGIFECSAGHHLTSFGTPPFDLSNIDRLRDKQVMLLRDGGILVIRDFVMPDGPNEVEIEIPNNDKGVGEGFEALSTTELFHYFAANFRSSQHLTSGVPFVEVPSSTPGFSRFRLSYRDSIEFTLRKDYRRSFDKEIQEEYLYYTQAQFEESLSRRGIRILYSGEYHNPWIVTNRIKDKVRFYGLDGASLRTPPTNYVIVGEKVHSRMGVKLVEAAQSELRTPTYISMQHFRHSATGKIFDIVHRPNDTMDIIPWFGWNNSIFVLAKKGYPRPIVNCHQGAPSIDRVNLSGYLVEPINYPVNPNQETSAIVQQGLIERAAIAPSRIGVVGSPFKFLTSPGIVDEEIQQTLVKIAPTPRIQRAIGNHSNLSTSGVVQPLDVFQTLRAYQVGSMYDSRLEIGIYRLLRELGIPCGAWIGAEIKLKDKVSNSKAPLSIKELENIQAHRAFTQTEDSGDFLKIVSGEFSELNGEGEELGRVNLEYVEPKEYSNFSILLAPLRKVNGRIQIGLEIRELPAAEKRSGDATVITVPAFRLRSNIKNLEEGLRWSMERFEAEFSAKTTSAWSLGGRYLSSPGVIPEVIAPFAIEVADSRSLVWVDLIELMKSPLARFDGHGLTAVFRAAHALQETK